MSTGAKLGIVQCDHKIGGLENICPTWSSNFLKKKKFKALVFRSRYKYRTLVQGLDQQAYKLDNLLGFLYVQHWINELYIKVSDLLQIKFLPFSNKYKKIDDSVVSNTVV